MSMSVGSHESEKVVKSRSNRRQTTIQLFDSDQVVQHILPLEQVEKQQWRSKKAEQVLAYHNETNTKSKGRYCDSSEESDTENAFGTPARGSMDAEDQIDSLYGKEVFKFRSLKKKGQMAMKAETVVSTSTPSKSQTPIKGNLTPSRRKSQQAVHTPTKTTTPSTKQTQQQTPRSSRRVTKPEPLTSAVPENVAKLRPHLRAEAATPYRLRKRNVASNNAQESSSDDSIEESSSEEEDEENHPQDLGAKMRINFEGTNTEASAENYFDLHSMNPITSDRTLSNLEKPRMDMTTMQELLQNVKESHVCETAALMGGHKQLFDRWMLNMCNGFNVLLHGLGSKRSLLESFRESHLLPFSHLVINGYFPGLTVKHILNSITEDVLGEPKGFTNTFKHIEFIEEAFKMNDMDFFMIINNIDGVLLRSDKTQNILSLLATIPGFHLIASIDHINAPLLWNEIQYFRYHWLWYHTPTFMHYEAENSYENSLMVQQSGSLALSSLGHVMKSLTPNAKRVFLLLAEYQLSHCESPAYDGMSFQILYHKCREDFLVNSDLTLHAQLIEFKDHRLVRSRKNIDGIEHLTIPIDKVTLKEFLNEHNSS